MKKEYTQEQIEISTIMKVLGHPARIAIIEHLLEVKACICGQIVDVLPLAQPTVSLHLKELRNAGLIKGTVEGNTICYCLDEKGVEKLANYFDRAKEILVTKNTCC
ncbi:ArsR/SmtB family transcription factor [Aequorivita viscosa]|uniref:Transcriptional regulator, ArsR family n=1 Tax=Aequorivita viscosa TaxID=797419 RepID=A0A1M6F7I6_9FLAO|nr:metalloregulator ArsR/SmtB family transcription factor [Aequorivita viscosa]SDW65745.1 transcriptional regulator, ArsR family [Aequorivita viscosa]SHI93631.1 transcriptional regulator, ArsR family [Aequorivita viscosa]